MSSARLSMKAEVWSRINGGPIVDTGSAGGTVSEAA